MLEEILKKVIEGDNEGCKFVKVVGERLKKEELILRTQASHIHDMIQELLLKCIKGK